MSWYTYMHTLRYYYVQNGQSVLLSLKHLFHWNIINVKNQLLVCTYVTFENSLKILLTLESSAKKKLHICIIESTYIPIIYGAKSCYTSQLWIKLNCILKEKIPGWPICLLAQFFFQFTFSQHLLLVKIDM